MNNVEVSIPAWLFDNEVFDKSWIDKLVDYCEENVPLEDAHIGPTEQQNSKDNNVRTTKIGWLRADRSDFENEVFQILENLFIRYNRDYFNFHIGPYITDVQYTVYEGDSEAHYDWHVDSWHGLNNKKQDRKLSMTIQLSDKSDYEGGEFETDSAFIPISSATKEKGTMIMFPSYLRHRVKPVTKGIRRSLVVWCEGPNWK